MTETMLAFLIGCMGARLALAFAISRAKGRVLKALAVVTFLMALGFFFIWAFGLRPTGREASRDFKTHAPIWWDHMRPLHALAFALVAVLAWRGNGSLAARIVVLDALVGLAAFTLHHSSKLSSLER